MEARMFCLVHEKRLSLHRKKRAGGAKTQKLISEAARLLDR